MKQLLSVLVLVAVAAVLWFALGRDDQPVGPEVVLPRTEQPGEESGRARPEAPAAVAAPGPAHDGTEPADPGPAREAVVAPPSSEDLALAEPDPEGQLFRVVHADTGAPVAGASLIYMGSSTAMSEGATELLAAGKGLDAVLERYGRRFRCDESGEVRVGDLEADAIVRARGPADGPRLAGLLEVDKHLGEVIEVPVSTEAGFEVTVVDPSGDPVAGATVELQVVMDSFGPDVRYPLNAGDTDAEGHLFLSNILVELGEESLGLVDGDSRVVVALSGFFVERPELDVDWTTSTPGTIELTRPATGRVEVTVVDETGGDITGGHVLLVPAGERTDPDVGPPARSLYRGIQQAEGAVVVFEAVERSVPFDLVLGSPGTAELASLDGLELAEDQDSLRVELVSVGQPRLAARALGPDGEPLAGATLTVGREQSWDDVLERLDTVVCDDEGRFEVAAPWLKVEGLALAQELEDGSERRARLGDLSGDAVGARRVDLGDVVLAPPPLLAAGRVLSVDAGALAVPLTMTVAVLPDHLSEDSHEVYRRWQVMSAPDGSFAVHGDTPALRLRLEPRSPELFAETLIFDTGSTDLRLEVAEACRLAFTLPDVDAPLRRALGLVITPLGPGGEPRAGARTYGSLDPDPATGLVETPPLPPGDLQLTLELGADEERPLYETVQRLEPGEARDLGPLRLERTVFRYHVTLDPGPGVDPADVHLWAFTPGPDGEPLGAGFSDRDPDGDWHIFGLEPVTRVRLYHEDLPERVEHALAEGENLLRVDLP